MSKSTSPTVRDTLSDYRQRAADAVSTTGSGRIHPHGRWIRDAQAAGRVAWRGYDGFKIILMARSPLSREWRVVVDHPGVRREELVDGVPRHEAEDAALARMAEISNQR